MHSPHPGQLRHLIDIGRTTNTVNENGFPVEMDAVLYTVWAAAEDDSSRYTFAGQAETAQRGLCFAIRWRGDIQPGMWVRWNGEKHTITTLGEYDFKRRYLKLTTISTKGVN